MFDKINLGKKAQKFNKAPKYTGISKISVAISEETSYNSGNESGVTLTVNCPWGSQEIADNLLKQLEGFQYQPYTAEKALIDPAVELGDGVTITNTYSGIYSQDINFGPLMTSNIKAPFEEELEHEFPFIAEPDRVINRKFKQVNSKLSIQADLISAEVEERISDVEYINSRLSVQSDKIKAKVEKHNGTFSSFGWALEDDNFTIFADSQNVLTVTKDGAKLIGRIEALSGKIGGFNIEEDYLSYNNTQWGSTNSVGVYFGPKGIQLGNSFSVDSTGHVIAESGEFRGTVRAGSIEYGGSAGYFNGGGIVPGSVYGGYGGAIGGGSISTFNTTGGINGSLANADYANGVLNGWNKAPYITCLDFKCFRDFYYGIHQLKLYSRIVKGQSGENIRIVYFGTE